jgi:phosphatidylglycerophosphate synthase
MVSPRSIVNAFSLSRVGLGLLFVVFFQRSAVLLYISVALCVIALITDLLDGFFARRWHVASVYGRLWDSLGDKSFYVGIIIAFNAHGFLGPLVSWGLIAREISLYITRVLFIEKLPKLEQIRPWTNWHGYFMYATIVLGLLEMYGQTHGLLFSLHLYIQVAAYSAFAFGVASIVYFLKL